ncbi:flavin-containing monooxygenase 9 [Thozetella sp. PMI_491]|nr:flavin-containing monooxygenase 9 [Thozetella sp. PMI_491]
MPSAMLEKARVAIIGGGPTGLSMLKVFRRDGFDATLYERRPTVGGLWAYSDNPAYTTALPITRANISKFTCGFSDYPIPDEYPIYMQPAHFQEFMEGYAQHFDLTRDIVFNTTVNKVRRNDENTKWVLEYETGGKASTAEFDRVAFCNGYQTKASVPVFEDQNKFEGAIMHAQQYRSPDQFEGKKVVVVGLRSSGGDIIPDLMPVAEKVYVSLRSGSVPFKRYRKGTPVDTGITWRRRQVSHMLQRYFPTLARALADMALGYLGRRVFGKLDPAWRLEPFPSISLRLPGSFELVMPFFKDGSLTAVPGIKRFTGPKSLEFTDGSTLDDIDAVVLCTGYSADWSVGGSLVRTSKPPIPSYGGAAMYRMWMNLFPPEHIDSLVFLNYSAFGKSNGFSFSDVQAQAISNVWRGVEAVPSRDEMERHIDAHQRWVAGRWALDDKTDTSAVKQWEYQGWLHRAAGTGMENLGWGWKGWKFWWKDRTMYNLLNNGVETAHSYRYFETGKRETWPEAREAILHANEVMKMFPLKEVPWPPEKVES